MHISGTTLLEPHWANELLQEMVDSLESNDTDQNTVVHRFTRHFLYKFQYTEKKLQLLVSLIT